MEFDLFEISADYTLKMFALAVAVSFALSIVLYLRVRKLEKKIELILLRPPAESPARPGEADSRPR